MVGSTARALALVLAVVAMTVLGGTATASGAAGTGPRFVTTWDTAVDPTVDLHLYGNVDVRIDWGDGTVQEVVGFRDRRTAGAVSHRFSDGLPTRQVAVTGTFQRYGSPAARNIGLVSVDEWGATGTTDASWAFREAERLEHVAGFPAGVTNMTGMFFSSSFNQPVGHWDVSRVTRMREMFAYSAFDQPIGGWDVSAVTDMYGMFLYSDFDRPVAGWDVGGVTDMSVMFAQSPFNRPIGGWDVSAVRSMFAMFSGSPFDQPIGDWDTSGVTNMAAMFHATPFDQPIGGWDTSRVQYMYQMFEATVFDQPIGGWDTSSVTDMHRMFEDSMFDQPIGGWDTSGVVHTYDMFANSVFDQPIGDWDLRNATNMPRMFQNATAFNQDLSGWCVPLVTAEPPFFDDGATSWTLPRPRWGTCPDPGTDTVRPAGRFTSRSGAGGELLLAGAATDDWAVRNVTVAVQDRATGRYLRRDGTFGWRQRLHAVVADPGARSTAWRFRRDVPAGTYRVFLIVIDTARNTNPPPRPWIRVSVS